MIHNKKLILSIISMFCLLGVFSVQGHVVADVIDDIYHTRVEFELGDSCAGARNDSLRCICSEAYMRGVRKVIMETDVGDPLEITCPRSSFTFPKEFINDQDKIKDFLNLHEVEAKDICTKKVFDEEVASEKFFPNDSFGFISAKQYDIEMDCKSSDVYIAEGSTDSAYTKQVILSGYMFEEPCLANEIEIKGEKIKFIGTGGYRFGNPDIFYNKKEYEKFIENNKREHSIEVSREEFDKFCESHGFETQNYQFKEELSE